jgi:hypothetical protein
MPQTYRTRHLTAGENRLLDALEKMPRGRELAAMFRPPTADNPPKPRRGRPPKAPADYGADDVEQG